MCLREAFASLGRRRGSCIISTTLFFYTAAAWNQEPSTLFACWHFCAFSVRCGGIPPALDGCWVEPVGDRHRIAGSDGAAPSSLRSDDSGSARKPRGNTQRKSASVWVSPGHAPGGVAFCADAPRGFISGNTEFRGLNIAIFGEQPRPHTVTVH